MIFQQIDYFLEEQTYSVL